MNEDTLNGILKFNRGAEKEIVRLRKENDRLNNIIDELENYMKEERINNGQIDEWTIMEIQMKLKELKEGK